MASYLYHATLYTNTTNVFGLNISQNTTDLADYNSNYRSFTEKVKDVTIAETTFITELGYTDFKALIVFPLTWSDVKEADHDTHYELYLLTDNPL